MSESSDQTQENKQTYAMRELILYSSRGDNNNETNRLYSIIEQHPQILNEFDKDPFAQTPLHAAAGSGQTRLAIELLNLMPSFGRKLNPQGFSPLHLALIGRHHRTALAILRFDKELVRVKGKDGNTPLHCAAGQCVNKGCDGDDLEVLASFLLECPDSVKELNNRFQSVVHVVMGIDNCAAVRLVLNWVVRVAREAVLGWKDEDGNTPLHLAVQHGCQEGLKIMVRIAHINKRNSEMKTPLDIAEETASVSMAKVLKAAGAKRGNHLRRKTTAAGYMHSPTNILESGLRSFCFMLRDLTLDMRNVVLVVAVLIATASYTAVLQPPGGVSQADAGGTASNATAAAAGKMVMTKEDYELFVPAATAAFTLSVVMIIFVLHGRPYNLILHGSLIFLAYSYLAAMRFMSPEEDRAVAKFTFILSWTVIVAAFALKIMYYFAKALFEDSWWLPSCTVVVSNFCHRVGGRTTQDGISFLKKLRKQCKLILPSGKYF
ncbi:hypothetical protein ABFX02_01G073000 [Erythranthe guttata]